MHIVSKIFCSGCPSGGGSIVMEATEQFVCSDSRDPLLKNGKGAAVARLRLWMMLSSTVVMNAPVSRRAVAAR
jgi:hypothetical protein